MKRLQMGLTLTLVEGKIQPLADDLKQRMTAPEWSLLLDLAMAIVATHESQNDGVIVHVGAVSTDHLAAVIRNHRPI